MFRQRLAHEIDEVGRIGIERARHRRERLLRRAIGRLFRDKAGVGHGVQHHIAPLFHARGVVERRQGAGRLNDARNGGGFGQRDVIHVPAEVQPRSLGHTMDGERSAVAEIHIVQIQLENLILGRFHRQDDGHELFHQLPAQRALARLLFNRHLLGEKEISRELLSDGAGAFEVRPVAECVGEQRADHADGIHAWMRVVAAIFDRQHRLHHARGNRGERNLAALLAARAD